MRGKTWWSVVVTVFVTLIMPLSVRAAEEKPVDAGKAEDFKGTALDLKEKGKAVVTLTVRAGKEVTVTVRGEKKTDVHLFVYDSAKKLVAKDDSPGPNCDVKFTPKEAGTYTFEIRNLGPGDNRCAFKVELSK